MKYLILILLIRTSIDLQAQNKVGYNYDNNGNRTQRYFIGFKPEQEDSLQAPSDSVPGVVNNSVPKFADDRIVAMEYGITVYPNPTNDLIMVIITRAGAKQNPNATVHLIDNQGKLIETKSYKGSEISFDLGKKPPGNYYLKVIFEDGNKLTYSVVKIN